MNKRELKLENRRDLVIKRELVREREISRTRVTSSSTRARRALDLKSQEIRESGDERVQRAKRTRN